MNAGLVRQVVRCAITLGVASALTACTSFKPPQAWEKQYLALPAMQFDADKLDAKNIQHIYYSKEGSAGGYGVGGGGCGCN